MKIHQTEIDAANDVFMDECLAPPRSNVIEMALHAVLTVRKQRKAAKRDRQRKEKDKQVVESAFDAAMKPKA